MLRRGGRGRRGHLPGLSRGLGPTPCFRNFTDGRLLAWTLPNFVLSQVWPTAAKKKKKKAQRIVYVNHG